MKIHRFKHIFGHENSKEHMIKNCLFDKFYWIDLILMNYLFIDSWKKYDDPIEKIDTHDTIASSFGNDKFWFQTI